MPNATLSASLNGFLLDTNAYYGLTGMNQNIQRNFLNVPQSRLFLCDVVVLEILRRRVNTVEAEIKKAAHGKATHGKANLVAAYDGLVRDVAAVNRFNIARYNADADVIYQGFRNLPKFPASPDCRIAAIAQTQRLVVVTANYKDFSLLLPDEQIVDWSVAEAA